jgi:hypothetical protein
MMVSTALLIKSLSCQEVDNFHPRVKHKNLYAARDNALAPANQTLYILHIPKQNMLCALSARGLLNFYQRISSVLNYQI